MEWGFCFRVKGLMLKKLTFSGWVGVGGVGSHPDSGSARGGK